MGYLLQFEKPCLREHQHVMMMMKMMVALS